MYDVGFSVEYRFILDLTIVNLNYKYLRFSSFEKSLLSLKHRFTIISA